MAEHEIFVGTDGIREFKLIVREDDTRAIATREDAHVPWSPPVELEQPAEVTC